MFPDIQIYFTELLNRAKTTVSWTCSSYIFISYNVNVSNKIEVDISNFVQCAVETISIIADN